MGLEKPKSPDDIAMEAIRMLEELEESSSNNEHRSISDIVEEIYKDMENARTNKELPYLKTGYKNFDKSVGGFVENGLTVIAGRPSMGKSSFTSGPIVHTLEEGYSVVLYSMEVADKNALKRLIAYKAQEPLSNINRGVVGDYASFKDAVDFFKKHEDRFAIVDRAGMTTMQLEIDIKKKLRTMPNLKLVIVDHLLQITLPKRENTAKELGDITKMLKRISQNEKISTALLSQLNREVEKRENKRPTMSDLQGSGSIEQDADLIVFLYRPEYYKEKEWNVEEKGEYERPTIENAEVIVGKNRDGPTCVVGMRFKSKTTSFLNEEEEGYVIEYVDADPDDHKDYSDTMSEPSGNIELPLI
jgi:replicative DNA helicase